MKYLLFILLMLSGCAHRVLVKDCDKVKNSENEYVCTQSAT